MWKIWRNPCGWRISKILKKACKKKGRQRETLAAEL
jgi:hypothetical protein